MPLLKLDNFIIPTEQIRFLNLVAQIGNETGIELGVFGLNDTFKFTGQSAQRAYQTLQNVTPAAAPPPLRQGVPMINGVPIQSYTTPEGNVIPVTFTIGNDVFYVEDIEWIDLATDFGAQGIGIEMRLSIDPVNETRQFVGDQASYVYDVLVSLVANTEAVAA